MNRSYFCSICGATINSKQKQTAVPKRTTITTENICENDHICPSCCKLAVQSYKQSKGNVALDMEVFEENKQSLNGTCSKNEDNNECLICGTSLFDRHSLLIIKPDPTELDHLMLNLIMEAIPPQIKIGSKDKVCSKCWFVTRRTAINLQKNNKLEMIEIENKNESIEIKSEPGREHSDNLIVVIEEEHSENSIVEIEKEHPKKMKKQKKNIESKHYDDDFKDDPNDLDFIVKYVTKTHNNIQHRDRNSPVQKNLVEEILLPNYKRCFSSSRTYIFRNCTGRERRLVPTEIREKMLIDYKLYIPKTSRVCEKHLKSNNWHEINKTSSTPNNKYKFHAKQIEDMFSMGLMKNSTDTVFHNTIFNYDDYFIEFLVGMKRETLTSILTKEPKIKDACNGFVGLLALLMKHENGGPDNRIGSLLNVTKSTLRRCMEEVQKILLESPITKEFGLEHLLK